MGQLALETVEIARRSMSFDGLLSVDGRLLWQESGGEHAGLVAWSRGDAVRPLDLQPESQLHAYGGGAFTAARDRIWYVSGGDGQIWQQGRFGPLTAERGSLGDLSAFRDGLLAVREHPAGDDLLAIDTTSGAARILRSAPSEGVTAHASPE